MIVSPSGSVKVLAGIVYENAFGGVTDMLAGRAFARTGGKLVTTVSVTACVAVAVSLHGSSALIVIV